MGPADPGQASRPWKGFGASCEVGARGLGALRVKPEPDLLGVTGIYRQSGSQVERGLEEAGLGADRKALGPLRAVQARGRRDWPWGWSDDRPPAFLGWVTRPGRRVTRGKDSG